MRRFPKKDESLVGRSELKRPARKAGTTRGRNEIKAVVASTMTEDELDMVVRGTPEKPGALRLAGFRVYHTRMSRGSDPGFLDIVAIKGDRYLHIELKAQKGTESPEQKEWAADLRALPTDVVEVYLWRPADWFNGTIDRIIKEKP